MNGDWVQRVFPKTVKRVWRSGEGLALGEGLKKRGKKKVTREGTQLAGDVQTRDAFERDYCIHRINAVSTLDSRV